MIRITLFIALLLVGFNRFVSGHDRSTVADSTRPGRDTVVHGLDIYLLIGQSNMAGRASYDLHQDTLENVYLFDGTAWIKAANPFNKYSTVRKRLALQKMNPGYGFAKKLAACAGRKIGLVVNARGGTKIAWWEKGYSGHNDFNLYEQAVKAAKAAMQYGTLKGIIWHQGESDQGDYKQYMALLQKLVHDLRHDLGKHLYFVAGQIGQWHPKGGPINEVISQIPKKIRRADYVNTDGLTPLNGDTSNPHFNEQSQLILGERYADKVLKKIYHINNCPNVNE